MRIHRLAVFSTAACLLAAVPVATALAKKPTTIKPPTIKPKAGVYGLGTPSDFQLQVNAARNKITTLQTPCADNGSTTSVSKKIKISAAGKFTYKGPITSSNGSFNGTITGKFTSKTKVKASITYDAPGACLNYASMNAKFAGAGG